MSIIQQWLGTYGRYKPKRDAVASVIKSEQERTTAPDPALVAFNLRLRVYESLVAEVNQH